MLVIPEDLRWPWALPVVAVGVVVLVTLWWRGPRRRTPDPGSELLLAHTARLRTLPRFRQLAARRRRRGLAVALAALVVVAGCAVVLTRPQGYRTEAAERRSRDIMICLDASVSMDPYNLAVVAELRRIVDGLHGDRIGMMIWSGASVLVFPLTDDYTYVRAQLDRAAQAFGGKPEGFYAGVDVLGGVKASLIGDGVVSCVQRFDQPTADRTRAVIVSSDDDPHGTPAYTLPAAAAYAEKRHVLLYGIGAPSLAQPDRASARAEFADAASRTGGELELLGADGGAQRIVDRIDDLEQARASAPPRRVAYDAPDVGLWLAGIGVGLLAVWWLLSAVVLVRRRRAAA